MVKTKEAFMEMREAEKQETGEPISKGLTIQANNLLKMDAATIDTVSRAIINEVQDGNLDPLDVLIYAKKGSAFFKSIDDNVKNFAYSKTYATKGHPYSIHGCDVEASELSVKYDYKVCKDAVWVDLNKQFEAAKKAKEDREAFLKTVKVKLTVVDEGTGEITTIYEPGKSGTMGYKISVK